MFVLLLLPASMVVAMGRQQASVTPVQKVIDLMNGMVEKGKKEKHEESIQFATYKQFCESTSAEKTRDIKAANEMIASLTADIEDYTATAGQRAKQIAKLDADISTWEGNLKAATDVRETEAADYATTYQDFSESIEALGEGIETLKAEAHATAQSGAALIQIADSKLFPEKARRAIMAFIQTDPDENLALSVMAPQSNAYEFQAQGVIDMIQGMKDKFEEEKSDLEKKEMNAKFSFETLSQDLKSQIEDGTQDKTEKEAEKGDALKSAGQAKADLASTTGTRDDDSKYLADLTATCEAKSAAFAERQQLRAEEIAAIEKAIEILASPEVAGSSDKHLPGLVQVTASLAQLRNQAQNPNQLRVAAYLKDQAQRLNSRILSILATRVSDDPFKKVKKMIKDLVVKLMEEANEEAEHKGWCDTEMSTNEQTRKEKTDATEALTAEVDELEASIARLTEEITNLTKAVGELDAAIEKATGIRQAEKEKNTETIADAQAAQAAVAKALEVLKTFYEKAGEATSLAQQQPESPEIFDEPYKGMGSENGGVVGMIEVIASDFARLETDTTAAEEQAQTEYDTFMGDSTTDKAKKQADIDSKTSKKQNQEQTLQEKKTDLDTTSKELSAAMEYYEKLKPSCVDAGVSYEDRVARRKEEILSLQEALRILSGEDLALLQEN
jgi:hypothetical protein